MKAEINQRKLLSWFLGHLSNLLINDDIIRKEKPSLLRSKCGKLWVFDAISLWQMRRSPGYLEKSSKKYYNVKKETNMTLNPKEKNHTEEKEKMQSKRRGFLKKAVYAAPTLMVMGQLVRPTQSKAWGEAPPSQPQGE